MIELVPFHETHREVLERLQLPAEQQEFTELYGSGRRGAGRAERGHQPAGARRRHKSHQPAWGFCAATLPPRHFPQAKHVLLVVNQRNPGAKRVYEKVGFQVTGERLGAKGPQWILTLPL